METVSFSETLVSIYLQVTGQKTNIDILTAVLISDVIQATLIGVVHISNIYHTTRNLRPYAECSLRFPVLKVRSITTTALSST
jgi:hypothetical protein